MSLLNKLINKTRPSPFIKSMPSPWIMHCMKYAKEHGIKYRDAMKKAAPSWQLLHPKKSGAAGTGKHNSSKKRKRSEMAMEGSMDGMNNNNEEETFSKKSRRARSPRRKKRRSGGTRRNGRGA